MVRITLLLTAALALSSAGCGSGHAEHEAGGAPPKAAEGASVDLAFAAEMIPHHEGAIDMAKLGQERAQSGFVRELSADILRTQEAEISTLQAAQERLEKAGAEPGDLGLPDHAKGMDHDLSALEGADDFDREFVDQMVPHHEGAVAMAQVELAKGTDPELKRLAQAIIDAQEREIAAMNEFREKEYGEPVPESHGSAHE